MDHSEALRLMATERYLLGELSPEMREAFEDHFFECQECALDVRAGAALIDEAKHQLGAPIATPAVASPKSIPPPRDWFSWLRPAFAVPVFAALLLVVGYQNFATIPSLRSAARQPRLAPWATLHVGTRDGAPLPVIADRKSGAVLLIDVPDTATYSSFAFALQDPQGKQFWTETIQASAAQNGQATLSLLVPGMGLQEGSYTLTISGITAQGSRTQLDRRVLDVRFEE
ncbi:MAG: zf-HC2 domain-containing protein [Acidobacteriaceae bacterium]